MSESDPPPTFPVFEPQGVTWRWPIREPIIGPEAKADLLGIKEQSKWLARKLGREVAELLLNDLSKRREEVPDNPRRRYLVNLQYGYCAVFWVLAPPREMSGAGTAVWIERVVPRSELDAAFRRITPEEGR
jgi:hypothetical protein